MNHFLKILVITYGLLGICFAQESKNKLYNPKADAKSDIAKATAKADSLGKNVLIQVGGNWCPWCIKFHKFCKADTEIDTMLQNNYVIAHLNYSPENKNPDILKTLDYPQRFGFPVIVILNGKGVRIHTQDTSLLEAEGSYSRDKIINFLKNWTPYALNPVNFVK